MKRLSFAFCLALGVVLVGPRAEAQVTPPQAVTLGKFRSIISSSGAVGGSAGCFNLEQGHGFLVAIVNTGPALTIYPQFYDEGGSPTCANADLVYGDGTAATQLQSGQIILLSIPTNLGVTIKLNAPMPSTNNLVITRV